MNQKAGSENSKIMERKRRSIAPTDSTSNLLGFRGAGQPRRSASGLRLLTEYLRAESILADISGGLVEFR